MVVALFTYTKSWEGGGVIGDISTRAERGGFVGLFFLGPLVGKRKCENPQKINHVKLGPAVGPVIGGVLTQALGWRLVQCNCSAFESLFFP